MTRGGFQLPTHSKIAAPRVRSRKGVWQAWQIWRWYDRGARVDFGATLLSLVLDWKTWILGLGSSAVTFIGTANQGWDPWAVWLAALAAGAFVAVIFLAVRLRKSSVPGASNRALSKSDNISTQDIAPIAKIDFKWTPGGVGSQYELRAIVTPHQNLKNFILLGTLAIANHYVDGGCKWIWEPAFRLLKPTDLFKGEVRAAQILFCWRIVTPVANPITIFEKKALELKDDQLLMLRVSAISDSGTVHHQEAYQIRKIGETIILDPIHRDHIAYIEGANDGL
jgi:hypothetical protein